jgi:K+-sensing histidine kinase KdpD
VHPHLRAASIVLVSVLLATLLTFPLAPVMPYSRDLLFIAAVIVAARYGGFESGLFTALLSFLVFDWFFDRTPGHLDLTAGNALRAGVFASVSLLVASLEDHRRRAIGRLQTANRALQSALDEIKTLRGLLPICMYCKQIRTDGGMWVQIEKFVREHSHAEFSHGVCPDCMREHFPDVYQKKYGETRPG